MQPFACLVLELRPNHYSCLVLITVIVSLAGGKETGKCDSKLNSEHTYMTVQNNTSLPSHLLASAPRYQWNHHFIFSKNFLSWPKKLSFFLSKQEILFFRRSHAHWDSIALKVVLDQPDQPDLLDLPDLQDIMVLRALVDHPVTMVPRDYLDLGPVPVFTRLHPARVWEQVRPVGKKWKWRNQT